MLSLAAILLSSALTASAVSHLVTVGFNNGLAFNPTEITADAGDTLIFQFASKNHSVTQSTFASPCTSSGGVNSGFMFVGDPNPNGPELSIIVNDTSPAWFYCAQTIPANHCQSGMVFALNPTPDKTFQSFQSAAMAAVPVGGAPSSVIGGIIPPPTSLPTGGPLPGASVSVPAGSLPSPSPSPSLSPAVASPSTVTSVTLSDPAATPSASTTANGASAVRGVTSGVTLGAVTLFAAVAGLLL